MAITKPPAPGAAPSDDVHSITTSDMASPALTPASPPAAAPAPNGHKHTPSTASTAPPDIESWTVAALESLQIGPGTAPIPLPLNDDEFSRIGLRLPVVSGSKTTRHAPLPKAKLNAVKFARDGKGRLGHRHLRRRENDHLASVPNAQPPSARDWLVQPTYPVLGTVPYALAAAYRERDHPQNNAKREVVPRDLRLKAKRMPAVRAWVRVLEEPVREFVVSTASAQDAAAAESGDEDLVIVDGEGGMTDVVAKEKDEEGVVVVGDGEGSAFRRWLTHAIADYYGLESRSVSVSGGAKVVCVGTRGVGGRVGMAVPRPLWEVC